VATLARVRGDADLAAAQETEAEALRLRFEDAYWMEDVGTYALALDGDKRQVDAIGSNAGHALWCGIVRPDRAARVVESLQGKDLWSGWGVRTLGQSTPGYNPIGYHVGAVWPHDNAIIAAGLARYGFVDAASGIAEVMLEATNHFRESRLPELFCGFGRDESPYPVPYPTACAPQAWAAGAVFQLLGAMLGLRPDAASGVLELASPTLPSWLPELTIENMRVGDGVVDLLFHREAEATTVQVLHRSGDLSVVARI
jgi:glycogen debranching enzyme